VQTIALQIPKNLLTKDGGAAGGDNVVIGVWTASYRQQTRVINGPKIEGSGEWVQVSRLGAPLVNEVVVPLAAKDLWNYSKPADDAQFLGGVTDPELAKLFNAIYGLKVPPAPRDDLVAIFLTGIPGATQPSTATLKPSEQLRLNMSVPPSANPNALGVVGGDLAGYPNGRRLADDVTDISLKAVAGAAYPLFHPDYTPDPLAAQLGDGVDANDVPFRNSFPYVAVAHDGTTSIPHGAEAPVCPPTPACPPAGGTQPPAGGPMPNMPTTGGGINHLADIYGFLVGGVAVLGGLILLTGYAVRRKAPVRK
jgi:hypothetical protein